MSDSVLAAVFNTVLSVLAVVFIRLGNHVVNDGTRPPEETITSSKFLFTLGSAMIVGVVANFTYTLITSLF